MELGPEMMALETHPNGSKGMGKENLSWVAGVEVEMRKAKRYDVEKGSRGEGRGKKTKEIFLFLKKYEDGLGSKAIRQPFPGNGAKNACWYFLTFTE